MNSFFFSFVLKKIFWKYFFKIKKKKSFFVSFLFLPWSSLKKKKKPERKENENFYKVGKQVILQETLTLKWINISIYKKLKINTAIHVFVSGPPLTFLFETTAKRHERSRSTLLYSLCSPNIWERRILIENQVQVFLAIDESKQSMASIPPSQNPSLLPEIGPDGLPREAPVIAYTEKVSLSFPFLFFAFRELHFPKFVPLMADNRGGTTSIEEVSFLFVTFFALSLILCLDPFLWLD